MTLASEPKTRPLGVSGKKYPFALRVALPVVLAVLAAAAIFHSFLFWSMRSIDAVSVERQRDLALVVIGQLRTSVAHDQESATVWDDAVLALQRGADPDWVNDNLGGWMYTFFRHNGVVILSPSDQPLYAYENDAAVPVETYGDLRPLVAPMLAELRRKMRWGDPQTIDEHFRTPGVSDLVMVRGRPAVVSLKPVVSESGKVKQTRGREFVHLAVRYLDGDFLDDLSKRYLFSDLRFSRQGETAKNQDKLPLVNAQGNVLGYFVWSPYLPGRDFLVSIKPVLVVSFLVLLGCVGAFLAFWRRNEKTRQEHERHIHYLAHVDSLTGLLNRPSFERELDDTLSVFHEEVARGAVIYLDLDRFKDVNDTLGHAAGDQVVREVAQRLSSLQKKGTGVFRVGGDEFVLLVPHCDAVGAAAICSRILRLLHAPFLVRGARVHLGGSIGVALFPEHGSTASELMRRADVALYEAKTAGRNRFAVFDVDMDAVLRERAHLEQDLRAALVDGREIALHYQPKYHAADFSLAAVEVLVRWQRPGYGWVSPAQFIPAAEASGAILPLGHRVLEEACRVARDWPLESVAVNVSAVQLRNPGFAEEVRQILRDTGMPAHRLELEVTETSWLDETGNSLDNIRALREEGIRIALDDFGTGFSSFGRLLEADVDRIKIDQSFIRGIGDFPGDMAIVKAIVDLARVKNLQVTAEGVETGRVAELLAEIGCDELQGYFFSQPLPEADFVALLQKPAMPRAAVE